MDSTKTETPGTGSTGNSAIRQSFSRVEEQKAGEVT